MTAGHIKCHSTEKLSMMIDKFQKGLKVSDIYNNSCRLLYSSICHQYVRRLPCDENEG